MMGHDVFFDIDNNRIGWAESSCDYTALVQQNGYTFDITGELQDPETVAATTQTDCESFSSEAKCQSTPGCSWYWGKCTKNDDDPSDSTAPIPTGGSEEPDKPAPQDQTDPSSGDDEIENFLDACKTPACRYPVAFGLLVASYCWFRLCGMAAGNDRHKYSRARTDVVEIELTGEMNGNGSHHDGESFRDEPDELPSNGFSSSKSATSSNGSYCDEPSPKLRLGDEPEFEGDFA
jgi:hypothetical protein